MYTQDQQKRTATYCFDIIHFESRAPIQGLGNTNTDLHQKFGCTQPSAAMRSFVASFAVCCKQGMLVYGCQTLDKQSMFLGLFHHNTCRCAQPNIQVSQSSQLDDELRM